MIDAFNLAASVPWLIQPEALQTILSVADRQGDVEALQTRLGRPLDNARTVTMRDGVAVIPVTGPIFRYANMFTEISGATSTAVLARDIQAALDNPYVRGIVLDVNSPGGEANGINELAKLIGDARALKPIKAYVGGMAASAGYWLAAAAEEVVIDDTAMLGSIGVVMSYLDTSKRDATSGVRTVDIVSSQSPDKRIDPTTDEGRAKVQATVDALGQVFVQAIATNRGVTPDKVLSDFGRGGVLVGADAVKAGMADRIGSLESVIAELAGSASTSARKKPMSDTKGQVTVYNTDDLRTALAAGYAADKIHLGQPDTTKLLADARTEAHKAGADAERVRIGKLNVLAAAGFENELTAAIENGDAPEAFALAVMTAARDRGITLEAVRKDAPKPAAHAAAGDNAPPSAARTPNATSIFAARRKASASTKP